MHISMVLCANSFIEQQTNPIQRIPFNWFDTSKQQTNKQTNKQTINNWYERAKGLFAGQANDWRTGGGGVFGMATGFVQFSSVRLVPAAMFRFAVLRSGLAPTLLMVLARRRPRLLVKVSTVQFSSVQFISVQASSHNCTGITRRDMYIKHTLH